MVLFMFFIFSQIFKWILSSLLSDESVKHLLTINNIVVIRWLCFGVVAQGPEPSTFQPERGPDGVDHTQASHQPHAGLGDPEAADAVAHLQ